MTINDRQHHEPEEQAGPKSAEPASRTLQLIWGILLVMAGIGVFIRVSQKMPEIQEFAYFESIMPFVRFSFYLMGVILIGGGIKKIFHFYQSGPETGQGK